MICIVNKYNLLIKESKWIVKKKGFWFGFGFIKDYVISWFKINYFL